MDNITAQVDSKTLQEKANEYATKGALKAIEDYYTGYDSPFKKAITASLTGKEVDSYKLSLPDIICIINERLTTEIDAIANTAIAKTFLPMVQRMLTRADKEVNFSDILKLYVKSYDDVEYEGAEYSSFEVEVEKDEKWDWLNVKLSDTKRSYTFTLHLDSASKKDEVKKYKLLSLPTHDSYSYGSTKNRQVMKISLDGATLELPFTKDILADGFVSVMAGYILSNSLITIDTKDFDEDWFPEACHCH